MNIAIIIGVSEYAEKSNQLPACKNDATTFSNFIKLSEKYEKQLLIINDTDSVKIMEKIDFLVNELIQSNTTINELLFYFSGHGIYKNDEFYFCTSDTNLANLNSTTISNSTIDTLFRTLSPKVYVKLIDACESGNVYIKDISLSNERRKELFSKHIGKFNSCYFFSSSVFNQNSYADDEMSFFTKKILSIINDLFINGTRTIKYRDLSNRLSDEFETDKNQTPFFVLQGPLSEIFLEDTIELQKVIKDSTYIETKKCKNKEEEVEVLTKKIPSEEQALNAKKIIFEGLKSEIGKQMASKFKEYNYSISSENVTADRVIYAKKIASWLEENRDKLRIFADIKYERVYRGKNSSSSIFDNISSSLSQLYAPADDFESVVSGFSSNVDTSESCLNIIVESSVHIPRFLCQISVVFSLTKIYVIYSFYQSTPKNWQNYGIYYSNDNTSLNVICNLILNGSELTLTIKNITDSFVNYVDNNIINYISSLD